MLSGENLFTWEIYILKGLTVMDCIALKSEHSSCKRTMSIWLKGCIAHAQPGCAYDSWLGFDDSKEHAVLLDINKKESINLQVGMDIARRKELDFFQGKPAYSGLRNVGTTFLSTKLSSHLIGAIRRQLPVIQHNISEGIINLEKELESLGGPGAATRGSMIHLVLQLCRTFEDVFTKVRSSHLCRLSNWDLWVTIILEDILTKAYLFPCCTRSP